MSEKAPSWVVPVMRAGYGSRAVVYLIVGGLAFIAAIQGGATQGTTNALADLKSHAWGTVALWAIAIGLLAYMIWRIFDAFLDLDDYGDDMKGTIARAGLVVTGLIHGAIGLSVAGVAMGDSGHGGGTESLVARVMQMPYGPWLVGAIGLATIGAGAYYVYKGYAEKYKKHIRVTPTARKLDPVMKFGCVAEGAVIGIVGLLITYAAITADPSQAGGVGDALDRIRSASFGRILLAITGLGLIGFAVENLVEAIYRVLPRYHGGDVMTLARRAKLKAEGKLQEATG